jgi:transcriptional adapter 3
MRLSYAEYEDAKEGIEKNLAAMFARLGNSGVPKVTKKKKKEKEKIAGQAAVSTTGEPAGINGLGLVGMDGNLLVTQEIVETVNVLKKWKELGKAFDKLEEDRPGLIKGLPRSSIYEGLDKEIGEIEEGHKKIQAAHQEEEEEGEGEEEEAEGSDDDVLMRDGD